MLVTTFGLQGSASTVVYNIAKSLLKESKGDRLIYGVFDNLESLIGTDMSGGRHMLLRSHCPRHFMFDFIRMSGAKCIVTTRNLRECATSLHTRILFEEVDCVRNILRSFAAIQTALSYMDHIELKYTDYLGDSLAIIETLEDYLEIRLTSSVRRNLAFEHSEQQIKKLLSDKSRFARSETGEFVFDTETQYNENHFSAEKKQFSPGMQREISRMFSAFERNEISLRIGDQMTFSREAFEPGPRMLGKGPGEMVLHNIYLPRGVWSVRIAGALEGVRPQNVILCQSGKIVSQSPVAAGLALVGEFEISNLFYDDDIQVFVAVEGDRSAMRWAEEVTFSARLVRFV